MKYACCAIKSKTITQVEGENKYVTGTDKYNYALSDLGDFQRSRNLWGLS